MQAGTWSTPQNALQEMRVYVEQKLREVTGEKERATFTAYVFLVAAKSPQHYIESVDRFLAREPGTKWTHELHVLHQAISEQLRTPQRRVTTHHTRTLRPKIYLSDASSARHTYFVQLLQAQGVMYPIPTLVEEYAASWIYARIDEAIAGDVKTVTE